MSFQQPGSSVPEQRLEPNDASPAANAAPVGVYTAVPSAASAPSPEPNALASTRAGRAWVRVVPALVLLALILVFVFQNLHSVKVSFFTASGRVPLAVALFGSAAGGALMVLAIGSVRILQLRRAVKKQAHSGPLR